MLTLCMWSAAMVSCRQARKADCKSAAALKAAPQSRFAGWRRAFAGVCLFFLALCAPAGAQETRPVLLISIDGLHPSYVLEADKHGLKLPVLRGFVTKGGYADRVVNVTPTVTYPNHTTVVTGVLPSEHVERAEFDRRCRPNGCLEGGHERRGVGHRVQA